MSNVTGRFWSKVEKRKAGCWEWTASVNTSGYGRFTPFGRGSNTTAHRFSWIIANGEIPDGACVLHRCDNRRCVNPDHLFLGTPADNTADMIAKGRRHVQVNLGERNGLAKLSAQEVAELRRRYRRGGVSMRALAREVGVSHTAVRKAVRGLVWVHVNEAPVRR